VDVTLPGQTQLVEHITQLHEGRHGKQARLEGSGSRGCGERKDGVRKQRSGAGAALPSATILLEGTPRKRVALDSE
jgi:hypothetical protein